MEARKLLTHAAEKEVDALLKELDSAVVVKDRFYDKLRKYLDDTKCLNDGMPSYVGNPPVLFYLSQSENGREFLVRNPYLMASVSADALNYIHHDGHSVLEQLVVHPQCGALLLLPEVLEQIDRSLFNVPMPSVQGTLSAFMLTNSTAMVRDAHQRFAELTTDASFVLAFPVLIKNPDALLSVSAEFREKISADLLNHHLYDLVKTDEGMQFLADFPAMRALISVDALNKVHGQTASVADVMLDSVMGRDIFAKDAELRGKITELTVNCNLGVLVNEGLDLLLVAPDLVEKIDAGKLNTIYYHGYGRHVHQLLITEKGQQLLNMHPMLCKKIGAESVNQVMRGYKPYRTPLGVRIDSSKTYVKGHIVFEMMRTEYGRQFLQDNDVIRRLISHESMHCKIQLPPDKGQCAAGFLQLPECENLNRQFELDGKYLQAKDQHVGMLQKLKNMPHQLPGRPEKDGYVSILADDVPGESPEEQSRHVSHSLLGKFGFLKHKQGEGARSEESDISFYSGNTL